MGVLLLHDGLTWKSYTHQELSLCETQGRCQNSLHSVVMQGIWETERPEQGGFLVFTQPRGGKGQVARQEGGQLGLSSTLQGFPGTHSWVPGRERGFVWFRRWALLLSHAGEKYAVAGLHVFVCVLKAIGWKIKKTKSKNTNSKYNLKCYIHYKNQYKIIMWNIKI